MKGLFENIELKALATMSKADKKKFGLDVKSEYKTYQLSSRLRLVKQGDRFLFFEYFDRVFPTVKNFDRNTTKTVVLDEGAVGPLSRGASVMAPGVIKYKDAAARFSKDDVIGVEILNQGIFAVGICLMDFEEMLSKKEGPVIEVLHFKGDRLDQMS